jgi:hypothetical protein
VFVVVVVVDDVVVGGVGVGADVVAVIVFGNGVAMRKYSSVQHG